MRARALRLSCVPRTARTDAPVRTSALRCFAPPPRTPYTHARAPAADWRLPRAPSHPPTCPFHQIVRAAGPATGIDAEAMGERPAGMSASSLVCLLGVCNCTGRLAVALAAESLARRGMPRSLPFVPVCLLMACAHLCVAANVRALLAPACALCGFAFGSLAALNPVVVCTLYGSRAFGAIYTSIMLAAALGSLGLSSGLAVSVYARALAPGEPVCVGASCFRTTALTCAALCTAASSLAAVLSAREARATRRRRRDAPRLARAPRISHSPSL